MRLLVTGSAGFIGSHLTATLLAEGHSVIGVDCLTDYYDRELKLANLRWSGLPATDFLQQSVGALTASDLEGVEVVLHLAAQPGVRRSWEQFSNYVEHNLTQTNHLALLCREAGVRRLVFASSSSVYGDAASYPTTELTPAKPRSPYGVTKLGAEHLLEAHAWASEIEVMLLRFFTVYGPGQRPDMAIQRLILNATDDAAPTFKLYGDGEQRRDFTFVGDLVEALVATIDAKLDEQVVRLNLGGSGDVSMNEVIRVVAEATRSEPRIERSDPQLGDVLQTGADAQRAEELLSWVPSTSIGQGVAAQVDYVLRPGLDSWSVQP